MLTIKMNNNIAKSMHESLMYFLNIILMLAAINAIPVSIMVKLVPGINEFSIPVKKSTIIKWFNPKTAKGKANKILPMVVRFFI